LYDTKHPENYNKEIKQLKSKDRISYNGRKLGNTQYTESETTIEAGTCSQEIGTGGVLKTNTKERG